MFWHKGYLLNPKILTFLGFFCDCGLAGYGFCVIIYEIRYFINRTERKPEKEVKTAVDLAVLNWIQENLHGSVVDRIMIFFTWIGEFGLVWIAVGIIMLFFKKSRKYGVLLLVSLLVTCLLGEVLLKNIICRIRPYLAEGVLIPIPAPRGYSFPSGHAASSFTAATVLWKFRHKVGIAAFSLALLISFSRLYFYVHYPTDILAGLVLGIAVAQVIYFAAKRYFSFGIEARAERVLHYRR